jgi:diaminohydroxyphosphoribosylaminopyrimidine deaminase/5-amino-6-(5-phosphoribosylamino)uracil reductase
MGDRSPVRVVADGRMRLPLTHGLVVTARRHPTWLFVLAPTTPEARERRNAYTDAGVTVFEVAADNAGHPDPADILKRLGERGITRLLIEGGGVIAAAFLSREMVDALAWFHAPKIIGGDGRSSVGGFGVDRLEDAVRAQRKSIEAMGEDVLGLYSLDR